MKRRTVPAAASSLAVTGSGCLEAVTGTEADGSSGDESTDSDAERRHHLYLENLDATSHRVALEVVRRSDDATVTDATYELDGGNGSLRI